MFFFLIPLAIVNGRESYAFAIKDYQKAKRIAYDYRIPMALIFTGSDWSKASFFLLKEWLFDQEAFKELSRKVLCVWIDRPELNLKPARLIEQDDSLCKKYKVSVYPLIILLDQRGKEICRLSYPLAKPVNISDLIRNKIAFYEKVLKKWAEAKRLKETSLILFCYQKGLELKCDYLIKEIFDFVMTHHICPSLLVEYFAYLTFQEKSQEAKALKKHLLIQNSDGKLEVAKRMALIEFQKQDDPIFLLKFLEKGSHQASRNFWKIHLLLSYYFFNHQKISLAMHHAHKAYQEAPFEKKETLYQLIEKISKKLP